MAQVLADAAALTPSFAAFAPEALRLVSDALRLRACGFFEIGEDSLLYLRYWRHAGRLWAPEELPLLDARHYGALRRMAEGFTVAPEHLGVAPLEHSRAARVDHRTARATPDFHAFACSQGWELELNVPLRAAGQLRGALVLFREATRPFTDADLTLAEDLARPITLAHVAARAVETEKRQAAAEARAAAERAEARRNERGQEVLREVINRCSRLQRMDAIVPAVLDVVAQAYGAISCGLFEHRDERVHLRWWWLEGRIYAPNELGGLDESRFSPMRRMAEGFTVPDAYLGSPVNARTRAVVIDHEAGSAVPEFDDFCRASGWLNELNTPLVVDGRAVGALCIYRASRGGFSEDEIRLAESLAAPVAFAVQAAWVGEQGRAAAVAAARAEERERAAEERAAELARANAALQRAIGGLARIEDLNHFLGEMLAESISAADAQGGAVCLLSDIGVEHVVLVSKGIRLERDELQRRGLFLVPWNPGLRSYADALRGSDAEIAIDPQSEMIGADYRRYHAESGNRSVFLVPMRVNDRLIGWVGLGFAEPGLKPDGRFRLLRVLADQMTMAAELVRLGEEARNGAVARERELAAEGRAARLGQANAALARSVGRLQSVGSLEPFLQGILGEALALSGAVSGTIFLHDAVDQTLRQRALLLRGRPCDLGAQENAAFHQPISCAETKFWGLLAVEREIFWLDYNHPDSRDWPGAREFHQSVGHRFVAVVPMIEGERAIGFLGLAWDKSIEVQPTNDRVELCRVLALQAALAVRITRLAEEARSGELARERERAALALAQRLGEANGALARSVARLSSADGLNDFLLAVLGEALRASGAVSGAVFLHDEAADVIRQHAHIVRGEVMDLFDSRNAAFHRPMPTEGNLPWTMMQDGRHFWVDYWKPDPRDWPQSKAFHDAMGHRFVVAVPMLLGARVIGFLGLAWDKSIEVQPTDDRIELCRVLAQQAALAVRLTRLAEAARQSEMARERERLATGRAAELALANAAMQRAIGGLARIEDLGHFLREILEESIRAAGAQSGAVCLLGPDGVEHPVMIDRDGVMDRARQDAEDLYLLPWNPELRAFVQRLQREDVELAVDPANPLTGRFAQYHAMIGNRAIFLVPMRIGDRLVGWTGFGFPEARGRSENRDALLRMLADQMTMAVELMRLASRERELAVAREQQRAALSHADRLVRANLAMQRSVSRLNAHDDLGAFLATLLKESVLACGGASGAIFLHQPESDSLSVAALLIRGEAVDVPSDPRAAAYRSPIPAAGSFGWAEMMEKRQTWWLDYDNPHPLDWPQSKAWHDAMGHRFVVCIPMLYGEVAVGFLGIAFDRGETVQPEASRLELCQVFALQAALAVRLTRLATDAREAALAREREQAATGRMRELVRLANALRETVVGVTRTNNFRETLDQILLVMCRFLGASNAVIHRFVPNGNQLRPISWVHEGRPGVAPPADAPTPFVRPFKAAITPLFEHLVDSRDVFVVQQPVSESARRLAWPGVLDWQRAQGLRTCCALAIMQDDVAAGTLSLAWRETFDLNHETHGLLLTVAHQIALVLRLDELAAAGRVLAVMEERERSARALVTTLSQSNEILRRSIPRVQAEGDLQRFLDDVLRQVCLLVGAATGVVYLVQPELRGLRARALVLRGEVVELDRGGPPVPFQRCLPIAVSCVPSLLDGDVRETYSDFDRDLPALDPALCEFHRAEGHKRVCTIPMVAGRRTIGVISLFLFEKQVLAVERIELLRALGQQMALAIELGRLSAESRAAAVVEERNRIARDLHDTLAQGFAGVLAQLGAAEGAVELGRLDAVPRHLERARSLARLSLVEARSSIHALRPETRHGTLLERLSDMVAAMTKETTLEAAVGETGEASELPPGLDWCVHKFAQEALANAFKHSGASHFRLNLEWSGTVLRVAATDDGNGFAPAATQRGAGLRAMRERSAEVGGTVSIRSLPGTGAEVSLELPLPAGPRATQ